jgi:phosphatidylglycerol lysyltransferase
LYTVRQLMLPSKPKKEILSSDIQKTVRQIVSDCPGTVANLALLPDKQFLFNEERTAFIMYAFAGRSCIAMSDPIGPRQQWDELLWEFREFCNKHGLWPVFYQIENTSLDLYLDMGMSFLKLGEEAKVELKNFSLDGPENRNLRYTHNKIHKLGYTFEIIPPENLPPVLDRLEAISDSWLKHKNTREKRFSLGSFSREYMSNFPTAIICRQGEIVAFANVWATSQKQELSVDLMRHTADCPGGIMDYLFAEMMLWGKQQEYEWFNLGMAPLSGLADNVLAPFWHKFGTLLFRQGEHFYNFQGLRQYKQKFNPTWHSRYLACPRGLMLPRILTNLAGLISGGITGTIIK